MLLPGSDATIIFSKGVLHSSCFSVYCRLKWPRPFLIKHGHCFQRVFHAYPKKKRMLFIRRRLEGMQSPPSDSPFPSDHTAIRQPNPRRLFQRTLETELASSPPIGGEGGVLPPTLEIMNQSPSSPTRGANGQ